MTESLIYSHSGSANHGCEALVRSTQRIINQEVHLFSFSPNEDEHYLNGNFKISGIVPLKKYSFSHIRCYLHRLKYKTNKEYYRYKYANVTKYKEKIALSIGGDNYCYAGFPEELEYLNIRLNELGKKTVLWGCSIEPELLKKPEIIEDMHRYSLITARETITYQALLDAGVTKNTKLYPDPAFTLETVELPLPENFKLHNTIGINVSPLIQGLEKGSNITYLNFKKLIEYILEKTDSNVALIPHVVWENNNDLEPLTKLYEEFKTSGRVCLIDDHNCMELKGFISRCKIFVGARTHATIAAYSTCVPTLVVGYSVKAKGIAKDIFGSYENYVLPVQNLKDEDDLTKAFQWMKTREDEIRNHLQKFMPAYIQKAWQAGDEVRKLIEG